MKTNSAPVRAAIRQHITNAVTDNNGDSYATFQDAAARLASEFDRVANYPHNLKRFPNAADRFHDYLMGIPFGFEFTTDGIELFLNSLGINPTGRTFDADKSARLYTYLIHSEMVKATSHAKATA